MRRRNAAHQPSFSIHAGRGAIVKPLKTKPVGQGPMVGESDMKPSVSTAGLAILLLCSTVLPAIFSPGQIVTVQHAGQTVAGFQAASLPSNRPFDYILIILMENKNFSQINGSGSAPYLNQLAYNYSLATQYTACDHPSLPNYMCLTGGNNYFSGTNCDPVDSCTTINSSIVDRVESAGLNWKAYMEDMPTPCYKGSLGNYTFVLNPFVFYTPIAGNPARCTDHVVPANSAGKGLPDDILIKALNSTSTASNYMWLTPNLCDNMHNCSVSRGDNYLSQLIPLILNSYIFRTQKAVLFITFDEGSGHYPADYVYSVWAGSVVTTRYKSSILYSHYSLPSTIETAWGLEPLTKKDAGSPSMMEFFPSPKPPPTPLQARFTFSPVNPDTNSTVNFSGSATGGTQPYDYTWFFGNGEGGIGQTITYVYSAGGNYTTRLTVTDASGHKTSTSRVISVDTDPNAAGTCQGCGNTAFPRTAGLMISFVIGVALPLALSFAFSGRRRRIT